MYKALVTGGAGFIGSNLASRLLHEGWQVDLVDDLSAGEVSFVPKGSDVWFCDFADQVILDRIRSQRYDRVFHLAAMPKVSYSVKHPAITADINLNRMVKLLEACRGNVGRFINTSSSAVYGSPSNQPIDETTLHNPLSPYGLQKSQTEQYCKLFSQLYNMDTVSVRPFNVFGPNQKGDGPYACVVSAWLHAIKNNQPLRIDGTGEQTRDLVYVDNVIDLFINLTYSSARFYGDAFNIGMGQSISNLEILSWFRSKYPELEVVFASRRPGDPMNTQASIEKIKKLFDFKPSVSFLDGLERTRSWAMMSELF